MLPAVCLHLICTHIYVLILSVFIIVLALLAMLLNVKVKLTPDGLAVSFYATMTSHARVPVTWQKRGVKRFARAGCNGCVRK